MGVADRLGVFGAALAVQDVLNWSHNVVCHENIEIIGRLSSSLDSSADICMAARTSVPSTLAGSGPIITPLCSRSSFCPWTLSLQMLGWLRGSAFLATATRIPQMRWTKGRGTVLQVSRRGRFFSGTP